MEYRLLSGRDDFILKTDDNGIKSFIPNDITNVDWQAYQAWLAEDENNQPEPAE